MIELLTGVPGSGKTYFAVDRLSKALVKRDRPIFTNINLRIPFDDILQPLDVREFHLFCQRELEFYEQYRIEQSEKRKSDPDFDEADNYDKALKESGLLDKFGNALILWDECHNDLDTRDPAYVRWMSYHRHFEGMDVLLITQNLSLIDRKYKGFIDKYYFGVNAAKRLFSTTFKYKVYTDHKQYEKFYIETISLRSDKKIFGLYDSGHYKVNRSAALKKLAPIFVLVLFIGLFTKYVLFGYVLGSNKKTEDNSSVPSVSDDYRVELTPEQSALRQGLKDLNEQEEQNAIDAFADASDSMQPPPPLVSGNTQIQSNYPNGSRQLLNRFIVRFQCTQTYCYFPSNRLTLPLGSMERFFSEFGGKVLTAESINGDLSVITALVPDELYYMIESHNIVSRSDSYGPQSHKNSSGGDPLTAPQFATPSGV